MASNAGFSILSLFPLVKRGGGGSSVNVDNFTLQKIGDTISFKLKTSADKNKVWRVQNDGSFNLENIKEWKAVNNFNDEELNFYTLYILTQDTTYQGVNYVKGFYTYNNTDGLVLRSSATEIDEETIVKNSNDELEAKSIINVGTGNLPSTNIKDVIYRKTETVSYEDEEHQTHSFSMIKDFLRKNNVWESISTIELTEEEYSHLTRAQKEDGTIYIYEGSDIPPIGKTPTINGVDIEGDLTSNDLNMYNKNEVDTLLGNKLDKKTTSGTNVYSHNGGEQDELAVKTTMSDSPSNQNLLSEKGIKIYVDGKIEWNYVGILGAAVNSTLTIKDDWTELLIVARISEGTAIYNYSQVIPKASFTQGSPTGGQCFFGFYWNDNYSFKTRLGMEGSGDSRKIKNVYPRITDTTWGLGGFYIYKR